MDLAALFAYLSTAADPLTLDVGDQNLPGAVRDFLTSVPGQRLTFAPGAAGPRLDGSVLTISGAVTATWTVDGFGDAAVHLAAATVRCTAADEVTGAMTGQLPLGATVQTPVTVTSAAPEQAIGGGTARGWRIGLDADVSGVTPLELIQLGRAGAELPFTEPPGLDALGRQLTVPASGFGVIFYPGTEYAAILSLEVGVGGLSWTIIDNLLTVDGIALASTVTSDSVSVAVIGQFAIGGVAMRLTVGMDDDAVLTAGIQPAGAAAFPGLAALAAWVGGQALAAAASSGLASIGVDESLVDAAISSASVRVDTAAMALIQLEVVSLVTLGVLRLDVAFQLPDLTISGSLHDGKPVAAAAVFSSLGLPADVLPAGMAIIGAAFAATPAASFYLAELSMNLNLAAGPLTIDGFSATISYTAGDGLTGQLGGTIRLRSGILFDVLAGYGGTATGWEFAGCTDPGTEPRVGDLLADLAAQFGISAVPEPVKSLTLSEISLLYRTGTGAFAFTCTGGFGVGDGQLEASVTITITPSASGYETTFSGQVTVGDLRFDLVFDIADTGADGFVAAYTHTGADATVSLRDLVASVSPAAASAVPSGLDIGLGGVRLLYLAPPAGAAAFALSLVLSATVDLSVLPLIGDRLPPGQALAVDRLQICYSSAALTGDQLTQLGKLLPGGSTPLPAGQLAAGVSITAGLHAGPDSSSVALALPAAAPDGVAGPPAPAGYWLDVRRRLGVVAINRIGLLYQAGALLVGLDAAIALGPLTLSLDGLAFGSSLARFAPAFSLSGLGLAYASGPLAITGALLRVPDAALAPGVSFQFDGTVTISAENVQLAAIGSYAQLADGQPSLFVFGQALTPIGGPPAFFVQGLMAGFGFNRDLAMPAPAEVTAFPLVALGAPATPGGAAAPQDPGHVLDVLEGRAAVTPGGARRSWISPSPGAIWLAFGCEFTSFELLRTRALLVARAAADLKLAVLGSSVLRLPQQSDSPDCYAYAELGIEALLEPAAGYFGLQATLSPSSYVIAPACHLTGGFAVAAWFGPSPHAGEFVVTLGGYHPAFAVPGHFPAVPRLGFRWAVSDTVTISGSAYAALTTSCVMAGGRLDAVFHDGHLRAWFTIEADLLVSWRPFSFAGRFAVSIGVSYSFSILGIHKTLSVSVGAGLDLWGPPTGGTVSVSLWVVSFTVSFGSGPRGASSAPLTWQQFRDLLPPAGSVVVVNPTGQVQGAPPGNSGQPWLVRATGFSFSTQSALPASELRYGPAVKSLAGGPLATGASATPHDRAAEPIDIKPMNLTGVTSTHRLTIRAGDPAGPPVDLAGWTLTPKTAAVPDALWGTPPAPFSQIPQRPAADVLPGRYVGYDVQTPPPALGQTRGTVPASALASDVIARAALALSPAAGAGGYRQVPDPGSVAVIARIAASAPQRAGLHARLAAVTGFAGPDGPLDALAASAGQLYSDPPMLEEVTTGP